MQRFGYFDGKHPGNNVASFLEAHAEHHPQENAFRWVEAQALKSWSFSLQEPLAHEAISLGAFAHSVRRVASAYLELGIRPGDRIVLFVPMSVALYTAMSALQRIGAIPVFLDSWARRDHLGLSARMVEPRAIISFAQAFAFCRNVPELDSIPIKVCVGDKNNGTETNDIRVKNHPENDASAAMASFADLMLAPDEAPIAAVAQEDTALITFTTGSSGTPKGADRTHRFLAAQHYALNAEIPYQTGDADLPVFPIFALNDIAAGVSTILPAIDVGAPDERDPLVFLAQLQACNVTCATLSPSLLRGLTSYCNQRAVQIPQLRRVVTGGAPISRDDLAACSTAAPNAEILVLYGSTEVEPIARIEASRLLNADSREKTDPGWVDEGVNVGRLAAGLRYKFLRINPGPVAVQTPADWAEVEVAAHEVGELVVAGEHVCRDYYNNPEAFQRAKIRDVDGAVWHRTGDLGRIDQNGDLWIVGRVHNAIRRNGAYIYPVRAEIALKKLPFVRQAAFLGLPDPHLGERAVCVAATDHVGRERQDEEMSIYNILAKNGIPVDQIIFRAQIPTDPRHHSKVEYDVLREQLQKEGAA